MRGENDERVTRSLRPRRFAGPGGHVPRETARRRPRGRAVAGLRCELYGATGGGRFPTAKRVALERRHRTNLGSRFRAPRHGPDRQRGRDRLRAEDAAEQGLPALSVRLWDGVRRHHGSKSPYRGPRVRCPGGPGARRVVRLFQHDVHRVRLGGFENAVKRRQNGHRLDPAPRRTTFSRPRGHHARLHASHAPAARACLAQHGVLRSPGVPHLEFRTVPRIEQRHGNVRQGLRLDDAGL
mmetsp:Transcript_14193/g.47400  ORF Transcript_14193/g.47400 Transcript_14193/m.47400 type:complete len:239 (-) Transcript_14193:66-782(-)